MIRRLFALLALLALCLLALNACRDKVTPSVTSYPPNSPGWLSVLDIGYDRVMLSWEDHSSDEAGFIVHARTTGSWAAVDTVPANTLQTTVTGLTPSTPYQFYVTAYNENGESGSTNVTAATTANIPAFHPPHDVQALPLSENAVRVTWSYQDNADFFLVQRRQPAATWQLLDTVAATARAYVDLAVAPVTDYYYRVATGLLGAIAWSDSALGTTPAPGAPAPPESLRADIVLGVGVVLQWADHSYNETRFIIGRAPSGSAIASVDSVPANTTSYTDSLGPNMDMYYYSVRAANAQGYSAWSLSASADYRFCSNGVIPLCLNNWWKYHVDTIGTADDYDQVRRLDSVRFFNGEDYYLVGGTALPFINPQPLYYLRNLDGFGCATIPYPPDPSPSPEMLFQYPGVPGDFYFVQGDCVLVTENQGHFQFGSTVYLNVYVYQRFFTSQHTIQYFVIPETIGIFREVEYLTPSIRAAQRDLILWFVQNAP